MNEGVLVSVVITNYNYGRYLPAAIESALGQTYPRVEVVVVDDGSEDDSVAIIAGYGDRIIPVLKGNGGQASAFNAGFAAIHGAVVIFLDADDVLLPRTAQQVADAFMKDATLAKIQYRMEVIDAEGKPTGVIKPHWHLPMPSGDLRQHVLRFPEDITWMATSGNAFSVAVLQQMFPMPEDDYQIVADWYLALVSLLFGPIVSLEEVGAYYRMHGANFYTVSRLDLDRVRLAISLMCDTHYYLKTYADRLGLAGFPANPANVLSVAFLGHRLISYKLEPERHPIEGGRVWKLYVRGVVATSRRFDVSVWMKLLYGLWFTAMALAPRRVAPRFADFFLFPEARGPFNRLLGKLHHRV